MSRWSVTLASLLLVVSFACDTGDEQSAEGPAPVTTTTEAADGVDQAEVGFESATASIQVSGDMEGSISLSNLREAEVVDGLFTATIASTDPGQVLQIAAPDEAGSATTGAGEVALTLEIAEQDGGDVRTFVAGEGTCTITMAPAETAVQGTFECSGLASQEGDLTVDASGSFAVNRS